MAYMNQEKKQAIVAKIKPILKKYGVKATMAVRNHSTLVLNIKSGKLDFIENFVGNSKGLTSEQVDYIRKSKIIDVNTYWYKEHFSDKPLQFLSEVIPVMNTGNYDNSDIQTDYFEVGWFIDVNIGQWKKPYQLEA
jgi:hypothetical protein